MSRLIVSISLLTVMTAGCFWSVFVVNKRTDELSEMVSKTEKAYMSGDKEGCVAAAAELQKMWDDFVKLGILVNDLGHAVEITSSIAEIGSFAQEQDDELYAACDRAQAQIKLFKDMQTPTLWKIL